MLSTNSMQGYSIHATDGDIGHADEFYFDDETWTIRYLVVDTGNWLSGRRVLISPIALAKVNPIGEKLHVALTKEQVEKSPGVYTHKPVSRQDEIEYYLYFGWPYYWGGTGLWGASDYPDSRRATKGSESGRMRSTGATSGEEENDPHLRSTKAVAGHHIMAVDGEIGHIEDFIVDEQTWTIRYIVVDTRNWWPGKKVLLAKEWIIRVSWEELDAYVNLPRELIMSAPEFDLAQPITRDYETKLYAHYKRPPYWEQERDKG